MQRVEATHIHRSVCLSCCTQKDKGGSSGTWHSGGRMQSLYPGTRARVLALSCPPALLPYMHVCVCVCVCVRVCVCVCVCHIRPCCQNCTKVTPGRHPPHCGVTRLWRYDQPHSQFLAQTQMSWHALRQKEKKSTSGQEARKRGFHKVGIVAQEAIQERPSI
jgi:hypothetical protein